MGVRYLFKRINEDCSELEFESVGDRVVEHLNCMMDCLWFLGGWVGEEVGFLRIFRAGARGFSFSKKRA